MPIRMSAYARAPPIYESLLPRATGRSWGIEASGLAGGLKRRAGIPNFGDVRNTFRRVGLAVKVNIIEGVHVFNEKMHSPLPNARRSVSGGTWMSLVLVASAIAALSATASAQSIQSISFAKDIVKPGEQIPATVTLSQPASKNTQVEFTTQPPDAQSSVITVPLNAVVQAGNTSRGFQILVPNNSAGGCPRVAGTIPTTPGTPAFVSRWEIIVDPAPLSNALTFGPMRAGGGTSFGGAGTSDSTKSARRFYGIAGVYVEIHGSLRLAESYSSPVEITFTSAPHRTWTPAAPVVIQPGNTATRFTIRTNFQPGDSINRSPGECILLQANATVMPAEGKEPFPQRHSSSRPVRLHPAQATIAITWGQVDG